MDGAERERLATHTQPHQQELLERIFCPSLNCIEPLCTFHGDSTCKAIPCMSAESYAGLQANRASQFQRAPMGCFPSLSTPRNSLSLLVDPIVSKLVALNLM